MFLNDLYSINKYLKNTALKQMERTQQQTGPIQFYSSVSFELMIVCDDGQRRQRIKHSINGRKLLTFASASYK